MRCAKLISYLFLCLLMVLGTAYAANPAPQPKKVQLMYTQTAQSASLIPIANQQGQYKLILRSVAPTVIWFTDRPVRKTGVMKMKQFVELWNLDGQDSFAKDNPNASIVYLDGAQANAQKIKVLKLSKPIYDQKQNQLVYIVKSIGNEKISNRELKDVAVFIDVRWCFAYTPWNKKSWCVYT